MFLCCAVLVMTCVPVTPPARAQDDASLGGIVRDASGAGIAGAKVQIKNIETGTQRDVETDQTGRFHARSLSVGRYEVTNSR
jgi:Carboxypeptidase regulatory-like domain